MTALDAPAAAPAASADESVVENRTFAEISVGDQASVTRRAARRDIELLAIVSGDVNPLYFNADLAHSSPYHETVAQGLYGSALVAGLIAVKLPGPGAICLGENLRHLRPVALGDTLTVTVTVAEKDADKPNLRLQCHAVNQHGDTVLTGTADVRAPTEKMRAPRPDLPGVKVSGHERFHALMARLSGAPPLVTAIAHPCDAAAIGAAIEAAEEGLIEPILVGPRAKILAAADAAGVDCAPYRLVDAPHSVAAAAAAVDLVRLGEAQALMKGSLHSDELLHAVLDPERGLRTGRRLSHVYIMDVPGYPRPLLITDAVVNIAPDLQDKRDIIQNAVDLAHILGLAEPRVAVLSAVEVVNPSLPSTLDAAALCKMAERGQITGALVDGPLAFDNAISPAAAREKGIHGPVAGQADILVVPDLEAGNMLAKQLTFLAGADAAGVVLGAQAPIILTSRADSARTRLASCAVANLIARVGAPGAVPSKVNS